MTCGKRIKPYGSYGNGRFLQGKRVLITGHTGFKGSWLALWLKLLAPRLGYSLDPTSQPSLFEAIDLAKEIDHLHATSGIENNYKMS